MKKIVILIALAWALLEAQSVVDKTSGLEWQDNVSVKSVKKKLARGDGLLCKPHT